MLLLHPPAETKEIDQLNDDVLLLILSHVSTDIKSLARCSIVSRRFRLLVSLVPSLLIHVKGSVDITHNGIPLMTRVLFSRITFEPFQCDGYKSSLIPYVHAPLSITHCIPTHFLKNFSNLRSLHIDLPFFDMFFNSCTHPTSFSTLLHWHANFGSSLHRCLILTVASHPTSFSTLLHWHANFGSSLGVRNGNEETEVANYYSLYRYFHKMTLVTAALIAASSRHYELRQIVKEHANLESLVVTDADGQGVLRMDRDQLKEMRKGPVLVSPAPVPETRMWEWFEPVVELSCGRVLKEVTLIAIQPRSGGAKGEDQMGLRWIEDEFDGMYGEAARLMLKRSRPRHHYVDSGFVWSA